MRQLYILAAVYGVFGLGMAGVLAADEAPKAESKPKDAKAAGPDAGKLFEQLDANKDGHVTKDEVGAEKEGLFKRLIRRGDANKDGQLTREELTAGLADAKPDDKPAAGSPPGEGPNPDVMFQRLDRNSDGKVTADEVPEPRREMFEKLIARGDKDGDKSLSKEEFVAASSALRRLADGARPNPKQLLQRLQNADKNGDGKLSPDEVPERMKENFSRIDSNGDGQLDKEELKKHVEAIAARLGNEDKPGEKKPDGGKPQPKKVEKKERKESA